MAQALRTVLLEPETTHELTSPQLRPRRRRRATPALWQRPVAATGAIAFVVGFLVLFISNYARNAYYEFERQELQAKMIQYSRECVELNLELDRLASQPRMIQVAQSQGLELPSADRVHYVRVANGLPQPYLAQTPRARSASWYARLSQQFTGTVGDAVQRLSRGPGDTAYIRQ